LWAKLVLALRLCRYTFKGGDESNPTNWEPNPEQPPRPSALEPFIRTAYDAVDFDRKPLCDILATRGGGWVWRHDSGNQRDYYVGHQKVLQYLIKPKDNLLEGDQIVNRTIVSKQWISKDILEQGGYAYKEYGEGGYAIPRRLTPASDLSLDRKYRLT
jgi:hypothetical protein